VLDPVLLRDPDIPVVRGDDRDARSLEVVEEQRQQAGTDAAEPQHDDLPRERLLFHVRALPST
jgi:hypothetical protein